MTDEKKYDESVEYIHKILKKTFRVPEDSVEYIESFIDKMKTESDLLRDCLITGSNKKVDKKIDIEPIMDMLDVLKNTEPYPKKWTSNSLNESLTSSNEKVRKYSENNDNYVSGLKKAHQICMESVTKQEIVSKILQEIALSS